MAVRVSRRSFLGAASASVSSLLLAACGAARNSASAGKADAMGANIKVMFNTNVMSLDTNLAADVVSYEVIADCIDGLMQVDAKGAVIPALAKTYEVSEDGLTYTFNLREATWSNGTPVTAHDFVYAWRRICKGAGAYAYMMSEIGQIKGAAAIVSGDEKDETTLGVTAKGDKTFVVELETQVPFFMTLMYFPLFYRSSILSTSSSTRVLRRARTAPVPTRSSPAAHST